MLKALPSKQLCLTVTGIILQSLISIEHDSNMPNNIRGKYVDVLRKYKFHFGIFKSEVYLLLGSVHP